MSLIPTRVMAESSASGDSAKQSEISLADEVLTLEEVIDVALQNNAQILNATEEVRLRKNETSEALSYVFPRVNVLGNYTETDENLIESFNDREFGTQKNWDARVELTQPLFAGGKSMAAFHERRLRRRAGEAELQEVTQDVVYSVKKAFFDVLLAESQLEVRQESTRLLETELLEEKRKYEAGVVSQFTVLRAEVAVANSRPQLIRAANAVPLAIEDLRGLLGKPHTHYGEGVERFDIKGTLGTESFDMTLEDALGLAFKKRPRLDKLELLQEAAKKGINSSGQISCPALTRLPLTE